MRRVLSSTWALLLGMLLLMLGNGLQGTLLGVRGAIEGFTTGEISVVMSAYFAGFLLGSFRAPWLIRRVGHVRVFAALGSLISAVLILYPTITEPWAWILLRVVIGFCFCGVYVTAESWLNSGATNETRGMALSLYMVVQMLGIVVAQYILVLGDPSGFVLFVIPSVLVSIAFIPILLTATQSPTFETTRSLGLGALFRASPLGCVGMFMTGGIFAAMFGMSAVYGTLVGLTLAQISAFVSSFYIGGLALQFPIGWLSDRIDRRRLILAASFVGAGGAALALSVPGNFAVLLLAGFVIGGMTNPLYALLIAYTNDYLPREQMPAASGGLLFVNGAGAILGPVTAGWLMGAAGPAGYFVFMGALMLLLGGYAAWRMTRRPAGSAEETQRYAQVPPTATRIAVGVAGEVYAEQVEEGASRPAA